MLEMRIEKPQVHIAADAEAVEERAADTNQSRWHNNHHHARGPPAYAPNAAEADFALTSDPARNRASDTEHITEP